MNVLAFSTSTATGAIDFREDVAGLPVNVAQEDCAVLARYGSHGLAEVEADLPGDRSIGYCWCGAYVDTGTWDERNA